MLTNALEAGRLRAALPEAELLLMDELGYHDLIEAGMPRETAIRELAVRALKRWGVEAATVPEAAAAALAAAGCTCEPGAIPPGGHELTIEVWASYGGAIDSAGLWRLLRRWDTFRSEMLGFAARHDLHLSPVFAGPALPHGTMKVPGEIDTTSWTTPHSLTGWPAATVRAGTSPEGLPIGVQVVAGPWRDDLALAAALRIERELGPWPGPPDG